MRESPESSKLGATPGKRVLIAVPAVVLVAVLAVQFGGAVGARGSGEGDSDGDGPQPGASCRPGAAPCGEPGVAEDDPNPWPRFEVAEVSAYDPFARGASSVRPVEPPAATARPERDRPRQDQRLEQLREHGVQAVVVSSGGGNVAVVGSEIVRVGDLLGEFRVVGIEADGVVLERPAEQ